jgi:hypothetical protein
MTVRSTDILCVLMLGLTVTLQVSESHLQPSSLRGKDLNLDRLRWLTSYSLGTLSGA